MGITTAGFWAVSLYDMDPDYLPTSPSQTGSYLRRDAPGLTSNILGLAAEANASTKTRDTLTPRVWGDGSRAKRVGVLPPNPMGSSHMQMPLQRWRFEPDSPTKSANKTLKVDLMPREMSPTETGFPTSHPRPLGARHRCIRWWIGMLRRGRAIGRS